jgi:hypothetical protein
MKTNEIKPIERALNEKSEDSVVNIANEIGELVGGWDKYYYTSFTDFVGERILDLGRKDVKNFIDYLYGSCFYNGGVGEYWDDPCYQEDGYTIMQGTSKEDIIDDILEMLYNDGDVSAEKVKEIISEYD